MINRLTEELDPIIPTWTERLEQPEVFAVAPRRARRPSKKKPNSTLRVNLGSAGQVLCLSERPAHCRAQFLPSEGALPSTDRQTDTSWRTEGTCVVGGETCVLGAQGAQIPLARAVPEGSWMPPLRWVYEGITGGHSP